MIAPPTTPGALVAPRRAERDARVRWRPEAWAILLFAGLAIIGVNVVATYLGLPMNIHAILYLGLGFGSVVSVTVGALRSHRTRPLPWWLFATALALFFVGDLLFYYYDVVRLIDRPFPSVADAFYLGSYPFMIAGIVVLIRRRGRGGHTTVIDSSIIAIGVGVLFWVFVIEPVASQSDIPILDRLISTAYPVMDVLVLAAAARLAVASFASRRVACCRRVVRHHPALPYVPRRHAGGRRMDVLLPLLRRLGSPPVRPRDRRTRRRTSVGERLDPPSRPRDGVPARAGAPGRALDRRDR